MRKLSEVVIRFFDLLEAEGRALKQGALTVAFSVAFFAVGAVLAIAGSALLLGALYTVIEANLGRPAALFLTGVATLLAAALAFGLGLKYGRKKDEDITNGEPDSDVESSTEE